MNVLLAIPLLIGPQASPPPGGDPGGAISFEIRLVDCETLDWRGDFQTRLHFGGHRSGSSAWVADPATMAELVERFANAADATVVATPKVSATPGDPAVIGTCTTRHFVVHAEPEDESGPGGEPPGARPVVAPVDDGSQIRLVGRPHPEGMHLAVEVIDSQVSAVHVIDASCSAAVDAGASYKIQVPEVARREMGGEWLLPDGHGLVLSLGVESAAEPAGKAAVRERLLLISARPIGSVTAPPAVDPNVRQTGATAGEVAYLPDPAVMATPGMPPIPASGPIGTPIPPALGPIGTPIPPASGLVMQAGAVPMALGATPWGLLPIVPVEFVPAEPAGEAEVVGMPLPRLPSRTLPAALGPDGRPVDPRTPEDFEAERTDFAPFVDGLPVPSPQVTTPAPDSATVATPVGDDDVRPASAEAAGGSMIKVRFSLDLARGFSVDVDLGQAPERVSRTAEAGDGPVRR